MIMQKVNHVKFSNNGRKKLRSIPIYVGTTDLISLLSTKLKVNVVFVTDALHNCWNNYLFTYYFRQLIT
jgi:hypothetical protein